MAFKFNPFTGTFDLVVSLITGLKASASSIFYSDASGEIKELPMGGSGKVLTSAGAGNTPTWETVSGVTPEYNLDGGFPNDVPVGAQSIDGGTP